MSVTGFSTPDEFDRMAKAVRREEARSRSGDPGRPARRNPGPDPLFVKVTGEADEDDYYPGVFTLWDSDAGDWSDTAGECKVLAADGSALTEDGRYLGRVAGVVVTDPLVIVAGAGGGCFRFLDDVTITGVTCTDGEITAVTSAKTYKWFNNGTVTDTDPGCP